MHQNVLWLEVAMRNALALQLGQDCQHLLDEVSDLLHCEDVYVFSSEGHVFVKVHLVLLHEQQQCLSFFDVFFLFFLSFDPRVGLPSELRAKRTNPHHAGHVLAPHSFQPHQHVQSSSTMRHLLNDKLQLGILVLIQTNKVLAPSNQLQVLKLLKRIEVEKRDGLTNAILHDWATAIIYIIMSTNLQLYKNLRVYRHLNFYEIINAIICNRVMKSRMLVAAAPALYKLACRFPGKMVTHFVVGNTFNRVFTGGNSLESVERSTFHLAERGIPIIIDYCAQGAKNQLDSQRFLDQNAVLFRQSATAAAKLKDQLFSIKISALVNMNLLEKYNRAVLLRDRIWNEYNSEGKITAQGIFDAVQKIYTGLTTEDVADYLRKVHNFEGEDIETFAISQVQFKMNHHPYNLYDPQINEGLVMSLLFPLDKAEKQQIGNLARRLDEVLNAEFHNDNNVRVLIDAEQSFLQRAIECIAQQIQAKYNQQRSFAITTLQNYLKTAQERANYELQVVKRRNLHLAVKLVRGAYLVQEGKVSKENNQPNPIVDSFQATTANYLRNFQFFTTQDLKGTVFVATHNQATLNTLLQLKKEASPSIQVNFAQLFGLGDHLTFMLKDRRQRVYKLLPWANTEVMIGYLIRRAEQLSQTNYPLTTQYHLLKAQLITRTLHG